MPGTAGHGDGLLHDHRRAARCGHAAAELAGDGRRRHGRQRVGHRRGAASRRHLLRGGQAVAGQERQPARERDCEGGADLAAGFAAHRTGGASRTSPKSGKLANGSEIPLERTGRYPTTEEVLSVARRRGQQGQSRCAARHHRRDLQRRRRPRGQLRRPDAPAGRADQFAGPADQRHHRGRRRAEPLRRNPGAQQGQSRPHAGLAARGAEGAQRQPRQHRRRVRRAAKLRDRGVAHSVSRPRTISPRTSRTSTRSSRRSTTMPTS